MRKININNLEHLQEAEMKGRRIDFKDLDTEDEGKNDGTGNDGKGWTITATARLDSPAGWGFLK